MTPTTPTAAPGAAEFQKRPVNIWAIQWTGENLDAVMSFCSGNATYELMFRDNSEIVISTLEDGADKVAKHVADKGDWIIRGIKGEFYPCKPDIFEATYTAPPPPVGELHDEDMAQAMQESSYRAGAQAGYSLGVDDDRFGLQKLLSAHAYPRPTSSPLATVTFSASPEFERVMEILRSWKSAQDYTEQYSHLPEARDDISGAWESVIQARDAALALTPVVGAPQAAVDAVPNNPTNLPESLGETVHEALVGALQVRGYRADGDNVALARRTHLMAMEDRDLINMQKLLINKLKERTPPPEGGIGEPS
jgi:hypothetical protein